MPFVNFRALRSAIPIKRLLDRWGWKATTRLIGHAERGRCPLELHHDPQGRSFSVQHVEGGWYCHCCRAGGDVIDLFARKSGLALHEAAIQLCEMFVVDLPELPGTGKRNG